LIETGLQDWRPFFPVELRRDVACNVSDVAKLRLYIKLCGALAACSHCAESA
jgi:hypothetical protein